MNNLEFKLVDANGDNVWWVNRRRFEFPREWTGQTLRARQFSFAWGPSGGKPIGEARYIEVAVSAGEGGRGKVWLSNLGSEQLEQVWPSSGTTVLVGLWRETRQKGEHLILGGGSHATHLVQGQRE